MAKTEKNLLRNKTIANEDIASIPKYYGYLSRNGYYIIMRYNETSGVYDYSGGTANYATAWGNRALETYLTVDQT